MLPWQHSFLPIMPPLPFVPECWLISEYVFCVAAAAPVPACCPLPSMTASAGSTCSSPPRSRARPGCWGSSTLTPRFRHDWRPSGSETEPTNAPARPPEVTQAASWAAACACSPPMRGWTLVCLAWPALSPWWWASYLSLCRRCCCSWSRTSMCRSCMRSVRRRSLSSSTMSITVHCGAGSCARSAWPWRTCGPTKEQKKKGNKPAVILTCHFRFYPVLKVKKNLFDEQTLV